MKSTLIKSAVAFSVIAVLTADSASAHKLVHKNQEHGIFSKMIELEEDKQNAVDERHEASERKRK